LTKTNREFKDAGFFTVQKRSWYDELIMLKWIKKVLRPYSEMIKKPLVLMLDSFKVHLMGSVAKAIEECNCRVFYIPAGTTSRGQVLDVGINKPFRGQLRKQIRT
jgi:hypothetical protein